jgi:hypothetical protein
MPATATVVVVGLCTILNMSNSDPAMVAPSAMCESPANSDHIAFIAFKTGEFTSSAPNLIQTVPFSNGAYQYVQLHGDEISLGGVDVNKLPDVSDPGLKQLPRMPKFAKVNPPVPYEPAYVPDRGKRPTAAGSFMRFGEGTLRADFFTVGDWIFRNVNNPKDVSSSGKFPREIRYEFPLPANFTIALQSTTLTATTPNPGDIWVGSSPADQIILHIQRYEAKTYSPGYHFAMYYAQLKGSHKVYIPYPEGWQRLKRKSGAE